jgi:hypothetical protein
MTTSDALSSRLDSGQHIASELAGVLEGDREHPAALSVGNDALYALKRSLQTVR